MIPGWFRHDARSASRRLDLAPAVSCLGHAPRRRHTDDRIFPRFSVQIVLRGQGEWLRADLGRPYPLAGPCVIAQKPGVHARYGPAPGGAWDEHWFAYEPDQGPRLEHLGLAAVWSGPRYLADAVALGARLAALYDAVARLTEIGGGDRLDCLAAEILRLVLVDGRPQPIDASAPDADLVVARIAAHIDAHLHDPDLDLPALVAQHGVSLATFHRHWRRRFTLPPHRHLLHQRLLHASRMLVDETTAITAIARACGFTDPDYFTRRFQAAFGCSPSAWRAHEQHDQILG
jgi:AraC-like DNA-binding protein